MERVRQSKLKLAKAIGTAGYYHTTVIDMRGLSAAFPFFAASLQQEVERRVLAPSRQDLVIAPASLGNGAGRLGAARLALERLPGRQG